MARSCNIFRWSDEWLITSDIYDLGILKRLHFSEVNQASLKKFQYQMNPHLL